MTTSLSRTTLAFPLRVMVVEDEALVAMDLEDVLSDLGCEVVGCADSAASALALAAGTRPDVAMMDVDIRGPADGVEAAAAIRAALGIPCVFVTARCGPDFVQRAAVARPLGFVDKPFAPAAVRAALDAVAATLAGPVRAAA